MDAIDVEDSDEYESGKGSPSVQFNENVSSTVTPFDETYMDDGGYVEPADQAAALVDDDDDLFDDDEDYDADYKPKAKSLSQQNKQSPSGSSSLMADDDYIDRPSLSVTRKSSSTTTKLGKKDAIKIISTPLGKVSIVYQSNTATGNATSPAANSNRDKPLSNFDDDIYKNEQNKFKQFPQIGSKSNDDFISGSAGSHSSFHHHHHGHQHQHGHHSSHQQRQREGMQGGGGGAAKSKPLQKQITPVLTPDGKVALLYRGAQEIENNNKAEQMKNFTEFNQMGSILFDNNMINNNKSLRANDRGSSISANDKNNTHNSNNNNNNSNDRTFDASANDKIVNNARAEGDGSDKSRSYPFDGKSMDALVNSRNEKLAIVVASETTTLRTKLTTMMPAFVTDRPSLIVRGRNDENPILPNINRPPSEVLGIKKNQFTKFRISDLATEVDGAPSTASQADDKADTTTSAPIKNNDAHIEYDYEATNGNENNNKNANNKYTNHDRTIERNQNVHLSNKVDGRNDNGDTDEDEDSASISDALSNAEMVNLAIIPAFESDIRMHEQHQQQQHHLNRDLEQQHRQNDNDNAADESGGDGNGLNGNYFNILQTDDNSNSDANKHHKHHRHHIKDLSAIHCAMQAMVAIVAMATVFGMLGAYLKQRILDQITILHW